MTSEWELLPCPFCGEEPGWNIQEEDGDKYYQLLCLNNGVKAHTSWHTDQTRAVGAWNRRSSDEDQG